jgi:hypothetical protein
MGLRTHFVDFAEDGWKHVEVTPEEFELLAAFADAYAAGSTAHEHLSGHRTVADVRAASRADDLLIDDVWNRKASRAAAAASGAGARLIVRLRYAGD